jgi:hypothetical protein
MSVSNTGRVAFRSYATEEAALEASRAEAELRGLTPSEDGLGFADENGEVKIVAKSFE